MSTAPLSRVARETTLVGAFGIGAATFALTGAPLERLFSDSPMALVIWLPIALVFAGFAFGMTWLGLGSYFSRPRGGALRLLATMVALPVVTLLVTIIYIPLGLVVGGLAWVAVMALIFGFDGARAPPWQLQWNASWLALIALKGHVTMAGSVLVLGALAYSIVVAGRRRDVFAAAAVVVALVAVALAIWRLLTVSLAA